MPLMYDSVWSSGPNGSCSSEHADSHDPDACACGESSSQARHGRLGRPSPWQRSTTCDEPPSQCCWRRTISISRPTGLDDTPLATPSREGRPRRERNRGGDRGIASVCDDRAHVRPCNAKTWHPTLHSREHPLGTDASALSELFPSDHLSRRGHTNNSCEMVLSGDIIAPPAHRRCCWRLMEPCVSPMFCVQWRRPGWIFVQTVEPKETEPSATPMLAAPTRRSRWGSTRRGTPCEASTSL